MKKSSFQKRIESQQKKLEELYDKYFSLVSLRESILNKYIKKKK